MIPITMLYGTYNELVLGVIDQLITRGPHIVGEAWGNRGKSMGKSMGISWNLHGHQIFGNAIN